MYATRSSHSSPDASPSRPRKKHIHTACGEPIKGHHRVDGALVCHSSNSQHKMAMALTSKIGGAENNSLLDPSQLQLQPGILADLEVAMERAFELVREALKARRFGSGLESGGSRRMPGTLLRDSELQRHRAPNLNPTWAAVAITALDALRDLFKYTVIGVVLLLWIFSYITRNDVPKTCAPS
ncbi:hypothetical protein B0H19DRAFT_1069948 [Mycena capillaripes]|nr:hypothetical protein B0H19DRAFT_1069948 [Mycena capillaripes]